jgi:pimeloyl-ACP methyl ester carboxylesterase
VDREAVIAGFTAARLAVRGLELAYHTTGRADGPLVVGFHGALDHAGALVPIAEALVHTHRVVLVDHRGHGRSGWVGDGGYYHFLDFVSDAYAVVAALVSAVGRERLSLVGHSLGGSVAMAVASLLGPRVERVALIEGMGPPLEAPSDAPRRLAAWTRALAEPPHASDVAARRAARRVMPTLDVAVDRMCSINARLDRAYAARLAAVGTEAVAGGFTWRFDPLLRSPPSRPFNVEEWLEHWPRVEAQVLSLYGSDTMGLFEDLERRHAALRRVTVERVEDAGHNLHHDHPEAVAARIARFVRGE